MFKVSRVAVCNVAVAFVMVNVATLILAFSVSVVVIVLIVRLLNTVGFAVPLMDLFVPFNVIVLEPAVKVPLFVQFPPIVCVTLPLDIGINVVPELIVRFPPMVNAEAAVSMLVLDRVKL
jgi:hypothetical protein